MNPSLFLQTVLMWSAQICVLVGLGAAAAVMLPHPRTRLVFWQGLLLILLVLPVVEPWRQPPPEAAPQVIPDENGQARSAETIVLAPRLQWRPEYWLVLIASGAGLRLLWICLGFLRLRRYRKQAKVLPQIPVPFGSGSARWYVHEHLPGPVTYGWLRPSILLPARFQEFAPAIREAIACHELVHVRRRDWLFVIGEEFIRGVFWFHPAIWFVLSRIQLAREQAVDGEVVRLTADRDRYLDALLAVAAQKIRPDLAPAPLFLKKRHLAARVAAVLQEVSMSKTRLSVTLTTVCSAVLLAARLSVWLFPFVSPAQIAPDDQGITVDSGAALLHRTPVHFPQGHQTTGKVVVEANLDLKGEVTDARVLTGPEELRKAALSSVLDWHYAPQSGLSRVQATIIFSDAGGQAARPQIPGAVMQSGPIPQPSAEPLPRTFARQSAVPPPGAPDIRTTTVKSIEFLGLSAEAEQELRRRLGVAEGDSFGAAELRKASAAVKDFDTHLTLGVRQSRSTPDGPVETRLVISASPGAPVVPLPSTSLTSADFPPPGAGVRRITVGGNVQATHLVKKITPAYPPLAKQARIQGTVRFKALIDKDGNLTSLQLISGHPLLVEAASSAVRQWVYESTLLNGDPVEVVTVIDVNFTLSE